MIITYTHRTALVLHGIWFLAYAFLSKAVWQTLIDKWLHSGTYSHGLFVVLFSGFLIYSKKRQIAQCLPHLMEWSLVGLLLCGLLWFFSHLVQVQLGAQLAIVGLLIGSVALFWGKSIFSQLSFPLFFLLLVLPIGYELIPLMQWITTHCIQGGLWLFTIPAWIEGNFITTSAGLFEVGPSCSGLRYVLAIFAFSLVYCHWQSWAMKHRLLFVSSAVLIAIAANGLRAACIIIWAVYTDTYYAIAFDHEVYGWIFFSFILISILGIARFFPKSPPILLQKISNHPCLLIYKQYTLLRLGNALMLALMCVTAALYASSLQSKRLFNAAEIDLIQLPQRMAFEATSERVWPVHYVGATRIIHQGYWVNNQPMTATLVLYSVQPPNQSLVQFQNKPYQPEQWIVVEDGFFAIQDKTYHRIQLKRGLERKTLITWYCINGVSTPYGWMSKIIEASQWLRQKPGYAAGVILSWDSDFYSNKHAIERFAPEIRQAIEEKKVT